MSDQPSQADRVLMSIVQAGSQGVTQGQWLQTGGIDGLGVISRVAARVDELKDDGLNIVTEGKRDGYAVYKLRAAPRRVVEATEEPPADSLFDIPAWGSERPSMYWDDAA
jgi:uncharacterized lipoprotein YddW (UPF0748 family)